MKWGVNAVWKYSRHYTFPLATLQGRNMGSIYEPVQGLPTPPQHRALPHHSPSLSPSLSLFLSLSDTLSLSRSLSHTLALTLSLSYSLSLSFSLFLSLSLSHALSLSPTHIVSICLREGEINKQTG